MKAPRFWSNKESKWVSFLHPISKLYAFCVARRLKKKKPYHAKMPVICVGNIFVGGVGKTPVCLALGEMLLNAQKEFFYLNHGYKAQKQGVVVNKRVHTALDVGDEALLLADIAPTIVSSNRKKGAQIAEQIGAKLLVMDDGFQNPSLHKTFSFVVIDGKKGFGNEEVLPAGPLREPILTGLKRADAVIIVGEDTWGVRFYLERQRIDLPIFTGHFELDATVVSLLKGRHVFAFAGLGNPQKFYHSLQENGIIVKGSSDFPDHYHYTRFDIEEIKKKANGLYMVTTEKDGVKLPKDIRQNIYVIPGKFIFDAPDKVWKLLEGVVNGTDTTSQT